MPADRRADYRAYDLVRRHELEIVVRLLEEILPEMPKPRGWSHQPHVGRPGPHRRGRPERFPWEPMAKALGLMHAMGWDYRQAEGTLCVVCQDMLPVELSGDLAALNSSGLASCS
jgi:hypothetical protein